MQSAKFTEKVFDPKKKEKLLTEVLKLTLEGFKPIEIAEKVGKETEVAIYGYQKELIARGKLEKNTLNNRLKIYETIEGTGEWITLSKEAFSKIPIIKEFIQKKSRTDKESQLKLLSSHISRLCVFCNTVKFSPQQILTVKDVVDFLSEKTLIFRNAMNEGNIVYLSPKNARIKENGKDVSHHPYTRAWASLLDAVGNPLPTLPANHILNRSRAIKGAYSNVALTYKQYRQGIDFVKQFDMKYLAIYLLMVEIFPRSNAVFTNDINLKIKYTEVDGKQYAYGVIEKWFEEKQTDYFTKLVIDPEVIRYIQNIMEHGGRIFSDHINEHKKTFNNIMRKFYIHLGLLPEGSTLPINDPNRPKFQKNTDTYYMDLDPTYTLRHTGAIFSCYRTDFQTNKVAKLGWRSPDTLEKNYAGIRIENLVDDSKCLYCNPPKFESDYLQFCRYAHAIAWFNNGHKVKES